MSRNFDPALHRFHRAQVGGHTPLPAPPPGRSLRRVWRVLNLSGVEDLGPVHGENAFLEDEGHDWRLTPSGELRYSTRQAEVGEWLDILLDYSTDLECRAARSVPRFDPMTGKPLGDAAAGREVSARPGLGGKPG